MPDHAGSPVRLMDASFTVALVAVVGIGARSTGTLPAYAIDDPYIHLSLARTLLQDRTFGFVAGQYQSASSAPAWDVLLAPLAGFGDASALAPLLVNVAAAFWLLHLLARIPIVGRLHAHRAGRVAVAALPLGLGLVPLVLTGMEHVLHCAIAVAILVRLAQRLEVDTGPGRPARPWTLYGLLAIGTLVRFETVFLGVGCAVAFVVAGRRWRLAGASLASVATPALGFAAVNRGFDQYLVPNSVAAKTAFGSGLALPSLSAVGERLAHDPSLQLVLFALAWAIVRVLARRAHEPIGPLRSLGPLALVLVPTTAALLHVVLADVGWFERYQAWLLAIGVTAILLVLPSILPRDVAEPADSTGGALPPRSLRARSAPMAAVSAALLIASVPRVLLLVNTPLAMENVHQNQEQLGRFLAATYPGESVIVNDIGWVSWAHGGPLIDVTGLGSFEVLQAREEGRLTASVLGGIAARDASQVMAVYDGIYDILVPPGWARVGRWCVTGRLYVLTSQCLAFHSPPGPPTERLRAALAAWAGRLPAGVHHEPG